MMDFITVYLSRIFLKRRSAICRGAILKGLIAAPIDEYIPNAPRILSTISRTSLGIPMFRDFQEGVHRKKNRYFDEVEGCYKVRDLMHWYIKKVCCANYLLYSHFGNYHSNEFGQGKEVETDCPIRKSMYTSMGMEDHPPPSLKFKIFQCESEHPPKYKTHLVTLHSTVEFQLGHFGYSVQTGSNGRRFKKLCYILEIVPSGASTKISVWIEDQRLGSKYISVQYD